MRQNWPSSRMLGFENCKQMKKMCTSHNSRKYPNSQTDTKPDISSICFHQRRHNQRGWRCGGEEGVESPHPVNTRDKVGSPTGSSALRHSSQPCKLIRREGDAKFVASNFYPKNSSQFSLIVLHFSRLLLIHPSGNLFHRFHARLLNFVVSQS